MFIRFIRVIRVNTQPSVFIRVIRVDSQPLQSSHMLGLISAF
jgi:hypothetical protein